MIVPIKIECPCGQHYAFDVEPVEGRMPSDIQCPGCGADGTPAANAIIARALPKPVTPTPTAGAPVRVRMAGHGAEPAAAPAPLAPAPAEASPVAKGRPAFGRGSDKDRELALTEARNKVLWGDDKMTVIQLLTGRGYEFDEARELTEELIALRVKTIRARGFNKMFTGGGLICIPVIAFTVSFLTGVFYAKLLGLALMAGIYGAWRLITGAVEFVSPGSEKGDATD